MSDSVIHLPSSGPIRPLSVWLAGRIDWPRYAALAERLAGETTTGGRNPTLVVFELEPAITIGRLGSRADVALSDEELASRQLPIRFTGRGGGAVLHGPGQVCVSFFAAFADLGFGDHEVGAFVGRFENGLGSSLRALGTGPITLPGAAGIMGRTGLLAAVGLAVRRGGVAHGAFVNVAPSLELFHRVTSARRVSATGEVIPVTMSSVEADLQRRVRLQDARTALVESLAMAFGFETTHIQAGFPVAPSAIGPRPTEPMSRVG